MRFDKMVTQPGSNTLGTSICQAAISLSTTCVQSHPVKRNSIIYKWIFSQGESLGRAVKADDLWPRSPGFNSCESQKHFFLMLDGCGRIASSARSRGLLLYVKINAPMTSPHLNRLLKSQLVGRETHSWRETWGDVTWRDVTWNKHSNKKHQIKKNYNSKNVAIKCKTMLIFLILHPIWHIRL